MFPRNFDLLQLLTNFEHWRKEIQFEQKFRARYRAVLFVNWHTVDMFCIQTRDREKFFNLVPVRWSDYE